MDANRTWSARMIALALEEQTDLIAWRAEDYLYGRYHLLPIADAAIYRLSRIIFWLSDRDFNQRIGYSAHGR